MRVTLFSGKYIHHHHHLESLKVTGLFLLSNPLTMSTLLVLHSAGTSRNCFIIPCRLTKMMPASTAYRVRDKYRVYRGTTTTVQVALLQGICSQTSCQANNLRNSFFSVPTKVPLADLEREFQSRVWWKGWLSPTELRQSAARREQRQKAPWKEIRGKRWEDGNSRENTE